MGLQREPAFDLINIKTPNVQIFRRADPCKDNPEFLFMVTKADATVEEAFHKNKHKQKSKDLEIQRLDYVLPCMCGPGKSFQVPIAASCKNLL